ncbi:RusA family crossover junction endodeoxyribonuclease [Trichocoleus sp. FACHB-262]|uniref:RusA family crossover junction endodeoxyribonuclease n=1 Tax=Trichocoleus sp. FACHB-262 TaxID=2692869 RepID=UPI001686C9F2|nr:RusA family crossover junction endodeoxyribonuclease [Trichocoleus sp. FACHB-262]MBD2124283.1 RusA family crossover junction endodeoxyribonuclease [Trichocoleus sp. FACHB-262]
MSDDELLKAIEFANEGKAPPPFGSLEFTIPYSPVSIQAKKQGKDEYIERVRTAFAGKDYLLIGDISIELRWWISAKSRYETDASADIDNVLKPTIDALTGPSGLFIDDCQVRSLHIAWSHSMSGNEYIEVRIDFIPDEWASRDDIVFIDVGQGLCVLAPKSLSTEAKTVWTDLLTKMTLFKEKFLSLGVAYPSVAGFQGAPRPFHKTRVKGFKVVSIDLYGQL